MKKIRPIILVGGTGTRLWPISRQKYPKQFIPLYKNYSLFDLTILRTTKIQNSTNPIIVSNVDYKFLVQDSLKKLSIDADIILEPVGRNTSTAIYMAAKICSPNDELIIFPSDHFIKQEKLFLDDIQKVLFSKKSNQWITFGIMPNNPSSAYGYMEIENKKKIKLLKKIVRFVEKPPISIAKKFVKSKQFFWNSGIFFGQSKYILNSMNKLAPNITKGLDIAFKNLKHINSERIFTFNIRDFIKIPSIPIDISIMEKSKEVYCYPCNFNWSDVGSWDGYIKNLGKNKNSKNIFEIDSSNNFIKAEKRLITTIDINDLIIIDTQDTTLISRKGSSEKVKNLIDLLNKHNVKEVYENIFENRPWGKFEIILEAKNYKVKKISVNPYSRISKQYHKHRSEHWTIIKGKGKVYLDNKFYNLKKGDSIDIPNKSIHYIENMTNTYLEFIEIQMGTYFGEDDIIRIDDKYGRT